MKLFRGKKYDSLKELVIACQKLDTRAQTEFYKRYKAKLIGICVRYAKTRAEGEDIFQEAFIKVFKNINEIKQVELIDSWVKSIVIRTAINYYNRTTRLQLLHGELSDLEAGIRSSDYESLIDQIDIEVLLGIISELPDTYRIIVNLHLIDGYTHSEIASMLSIAEGTARSQYHRAKNILMRKLQEIGIRRYEIPG